ncbi:syntaxin-5 [Palaemon carinicauda]|uniref:syntaxin-5 n=1 Tax=Palaemon carinicauda TaxID=392227 RepID=UPI0035B60D94
MTTRRRRAGSESYVEELPVPATSVTESNLQRQSLLNSPQASYPNSPQVASAISERGVWGAPVSVAGDHAYYKKTDTFKPSTGVKNIVETQNLSYPGQLNSNFNGTLTISENTYPLNNSRVDGQSYTWSSDSGNLNNKQSFGYPTWSSFGDIEDSEMASRDRTQEFVRIVRSQQGSQTNNLLPQNSRRPRDLRQYTDFMQRSKLIGRNISSTYAKLEKLTHLAKKRSLFDDSHDLEVQELTGIIRHDLTSLTKQLTDLRNQSRVASPNGTSAHLQKHSSNLVGSLQTKVAFITQKFKDILEVRTENLKKQAERRDHFTGGAVSGELPPGAISGHHHGSVLVADEASAFSTSLDSSRSNGEVVINFGSGGTYHQQLQLMEEQDTYLQSRADTMRTIESTIVELGQMFTQLATMVKEQEELVHRIDANVEDAELNVEAAHSELLKYFKSVSSNRMLMIKVFGIMIVFFVIFVVFMA